MIDMKGLQQLLIVAAVSWCFISFVLPFLSGWYFLARRYRLTQAFDGKRWHFCNGFPRLLNYGNTLTLGANAQGFYMAVLFLFRVGHPPLFIPWMDIRTESYRFFYLPMVKLHFLRNPSIKLWLWRSTAEKLSAASQGGLALAQRL